MDLIYAGRYTEVCDYRWADAKYSTVELPSGIWHVDTAAIPEFFDRIRDSSRRYVVVSPSCDFGVCYQKYNHPAMDLEKWAGLNMTPGWGYEDLHMEARIDRDRCTESDTYSIKCWSYTAATFPDIPSSVAHWFVVNCEIDHPLVTPIPFGVFGNKDLTDTAQTIDEYFSAATPPRDKLLYVNFQFYNTDRYRYYKHFDKIDGATCKQGCSFDEFLCDLATHKYVLCPTGNGIDCYRTLEAIYMGAIPILENRMGAVAPYAKAGYPILVFNDLRQVDPSILNIKYAQYNNIKRGDTSKLLWPYWRDKITACSSTG